MSDTQAELDNDRIYQNLMHLHKQEHIGDECFCTTEVAGVYRNVLKEITAHTNKFATTAALDRLAAKLRAYRARGLNDSQSSLLSALSDDIEEERARVRGGAA